MEDIQIRIMIHVEYGNQVIYLLVLPYRRIFTQSQRPPGVSSSLQLGAAGGSRGKLSTRDSEIIEFGLDLMEIACPQ